MISKNVKIRRRRSPETAGRTEASRWGGSLTSFRNEINQLFENFFGDTGDLSWSFQNRFPALDIIEGEKDYTLKAELPGIDPDEIEISITDNYLKISGEKREEEHEESTNYLRNEVSYGAFERTISLPQSAQTEDAEAQYKDGVLTVSVPKKASALQKPKRLQIKKAA